MRRLAMIALAALQPPSCWYGRTSVLRARQTAREMVPEVWASTRSRRVRTGRNRDAVGALTEIHRALRPGGRVLVWDVDWATVWWHSTDPDRMRRVLRAWDEHLVHPSLPRTLGLHLRAAGFTDVVVAGHSFATVDYDTETFAVAMLGMVADFVPGRGGVTGDEVTAWVAEQRDLAEQGEFFFEGTQFCFTATKPG